MAKLSKQSYKDDQAFLCYERKGHQCLWCGEPATQLAHRIPQDKTMLKRYGYMTIHHWMNRDPVCGLRCNAKSNIRNHPIEIGVLVA
jgi:5-methylcytosine-specific restriction endonuclease McrA